MCITSLEKWQVLYYKYPAKDFIVVQDPEKFGYSIIIGNSVFTHQGLTLDLDADRLYRHNEREFDEFYMTQLQDRFRLHGKSVSVAFNQLEPVDVTIKGSIGFSEIVRLPVSPLSPNVMGPFTFIPFLPTYHGIISLHHKTQGKLQLITSKLTKTLIVDGEGYVEKDHGSYFPKSYIWLQAMTWAKASSRGSTLLLSSARVPVVGQVMTTAFLCLFYDSSTKLTHNFGTYTGSEMKELTFSMDGQVQVMNVVMKHQLETLKITARREFANSIPVIGPDFKKGMELLIEEALEGTVSVELLIRDKIVFKDEGFQTGIEINGPMGEMITKPE
jgi:hypothetical protein